MSYVISQCTSNSGTPTTPIKAYMPMMAHVDFSATLSATALPSLGLATHRRVNASMNAATATDAGYQMNGLSATRPNAVTAVDNIRDRVMGKCASSMTSAHRIVSDYAQSISLGMVRHRWFVQASSALRSLRRMPVRE